MHVAVHYYNSPLLTEAKFKTWYVGTLLCDAVKRLHLQTPIGDHFGLFRSEHRNFSFQSIVHNLLHT
jgi:hypothetical protein